MASILAMVFEHNRWANLRAVDACAGLSDDQLGATVPGCAGAIRDTLMHVAGAEQRYLMRLAGRPPAYGERDGWPGVETLRQLLDDSGRAFVELAERADPDELLRGEYQGRPYELPAYLLYVQAVNHATEHRSQVATILTQLGVEPPDFSGWAWDAHRATRSG
jgi:uncharacterized damage-inducible protein DinB